MGRRSRNPRRDWWNPIDWVDATLESAETFIRDEDPPPRRKRIDTTERKPKKEERNG